jgi:1,4-alpha-glucan branching enzyme
MSIHSHSHSHHKINPRYSAKKSVRAINFFCDAPEAKKVSIVGSFNEWKPDAAPMRKAPDGRWMVQVELHHGHHHYLFLADGHPILDPKAQGAVRDKNPWSEKASVIAVS